VTPTDDFDASNNDAERSRRWIFVYIHKTNDAKSTLGKFGTVSSPCMGIHYVDKEDRTLPVTRIQHSKLLALGVMLSWGVVGFLLHLVEISWAIAFPYSPFQISGHLKN